MLPENLKLLIQSILTNGWTMPIVITPDNVIVDGFHRWMVSGIEPLLSRLQGMVPVAVVEHADADANVYGTITHNQIGRAHV